MLLIAIVDELEKQLAHQGPPAALSYFFCQGTDKNLNNAAAVLRGLVYLLGDKYPPLVSHLRKRYDNSHSKLFEDANAFFTLSEVLEDMLRDASLSRAYIVIDALDECGTGLPRLLKFIVQNSSISPRVKWIVSSRNRPDIKQQLKLDNSGMKLSLELTQNAEQVAHAVNAYIDFKISRLLLLDDNDKVRVRDTMRKKANGIFLWVALVIQELEKPDVESWHVLQIVEEVPAGLEELYALMMNQIQQSKRDSESCRLVLSAATIMYRPLRLAEMAVLSGLPPEISSKLESVEKIVAKCGLFLTIQDGFVYFIHQSAKDYLSDQASTMSTTLHRNIYNLRRPGLLIGEIKALDPDLLAAIRYSCVHWISYFCDTYSNSRPEVKTIGQFLREKFLYWLETLGLIQHMGDVILSITRLENLLKEQSCDGELLDLVQDSRRFLLQNRWVGENAPLQAYASALIFSPVSCLARKIFEKEAEWIKIKPVVASAWSSCLQTLEGHSDWVTSVVFSHDSKLLASASDDGIVKIWGAATGSLQQTLELGTIVQTMSFEDTGLYLDTNIGRIDLAAETKKIQSVPQIPHPDQAQQVQYYGYALSRDRSWIAWNKHNVLWLPTDYRPFTYSISSFASLSTLSMVTRIGLGCSSGRVVVIGLLGSGPSYFSEP
ncbi:hypothetical protein NUW58_g9501 [Xylaria curta]|uniref:Uncharacterized protein n=1 Tax=Xylaria curta TaxID=42375 RepID=A0ACC1MY09_9PEZI|nr:hypothetical protein NUW58_g9501 [Xylaria curta]